MNDQFTVVREFLQILKHSTEAKKCLELQVAEFGKALEREPSRDPSKEAVIFEDSGSFRLVNGLQWETELSSDEKYDLIFGILPIGLHKEEYIHKETSLKVRKNWIELLKSLSYLNETATGIYLIEPSGFSQSDGQQFVALLEDNGFYVSAYFNAPEGLLKPHSAIRPILAEISRKAPESLFLGELHSRPQIERLLENRKLNAETGNPIGGMRVGLPKFHSFDGIEASLQLSALESQYKEFETFPLKDISLEINSLPQEGSFSELDNCFYIQRMGNFQVIENLGDIPAKQSNYFQVVMKPEISASYLRCFLASEMGQLSLRSIGRGSTHKSISRPALSNVLVAIPSTENQSIISKTEKKLEELTTSVSGLGGEFALNPTGSRQLLLQVEAMLDVIGGLSEADRVLSICRAGESNVVEFKESLSLDMQKGSKEKYIETASLKTIAAFLNSDGGCLLIGVMDSGEVPGINTEVEKLYKNHDKFLLHFKNLLQSQVGEEFYPFIQYGLVDVNGYTVLKLDCIPAKSPCYLGGKDFYVRTNPATDRLQGPKLVEYVKNHFS